MELPWKWRTKRTIGRITCYTFCLKSGILLRATKRLIEYGGSPKLMPFSHMYYVVEDNRSEGLNNFGSGSSFKEAFSEYKSSINNLN
jgi:hypothetical protein